MSNPPIQSTLDRTFKTLVVTAIIIYGLILVRDIVLPMVFAGIFDVVLSPVAMFIEKRTGRILSIVIVLVAALSLMLLLTWFTIAQLSALVKSLPNLESQFTEFINNITFSIDQYFRISTEDQGKLLKDGLTGLTKVASEVVSSTGYLAYFFVQVPIYIFLFLFYREKLRLFFESFSPGGEMKWKKEIEAVIRGYISGLTIVVFIAGVLNSIGLFFLGIDHPIFFGFLSGTLTVIPYIGITIGASLPAILALVTKDSAWYAVGVVAVHAVVQFLEGNFITPKVTGSRISINAMAAILALIVGGKIWGIPGMILAVPAIGIAKILMSYSPSYKPLAALIDDRAVPEPVQIETDESANEQSTLNENNENAEEETES
jgi:predicted PurR-regulated permease PerM